MRLCIGSTRLAAALATALAAGGALCAQAPDRFGLVKVEVYHEATSRLLFVCIDANADDRLDLAEAGQALETVDGIRDRTSFRRLDQDRDGFLSWPEFDAHLREVIRSGETFYLHPIRPELLQVDMVVSREPEKDPTVMGRVDRDHSGTLSREEVLVLLNATGRTLQGAGVRVLTASDGPEALRLARSLHPVAITLDVMMPGMDGWEVLRELKADPATRDIPGIMGTMTESFLE